MDEMQENENREALRRRQAAERRAQLKRQKERQMWFRAHVKMIATGLCGLFVLLVIVLFVRALRQNAATDDGEAQAQGDGTWESTVVEPELTVFDGAEVTVSAKPDEGGAQAQLQNGDGENGAGEADNFSGAGSADGGAEDEASGMMADGRATAEGSGQDDGSQEETAEAMTAGSSVKTGNVRFVSGYQAKSTAKTIQIPEDENMQSTYAILIDESSGTIVAQKESKTVISPASMTKILTVLVAAEQLDLDEQLDDKVTVTIDMTDYAYRNGLSVVGFDVDEEVTVRDLFYGTILPSGADAAIALATYTAGSEEKFVELMNDKLQELGLSNTAHFTNCVGLYNEQHHCTVYDMAMILKAAVENDFCREVLAAHTYNTSKTEQHPEGLLISNWFLRRIEDKDTGGEVFCAKTGFVNESGSCAASYEVSGSGVPYICVTANAHSSWRCIYDHVTIYSRYAR